jgi:hypothetical protein
MVKSLFRGNRRSSKMKRLFGLSASAALLAGCGGPQPPVGTPGTVPQTSQLSMRVPTGMSWMVQNAARISRLIYASDGTVVNVYNYDTAAQVGSLSGFNDAYGQCVDKRGDVFITSSIGSYGEILEYRHGGSTPIGTFDTDGHPIGCSISPLGGDLAVDNGTPSGGSDVQIWKHAQGSPSSYTNQNDCGQMWPPGYDNKGNLFMEVGPDVCELPVGGTSLTSVTLNHSLGFPGSIMWDGKYLALTDQSYAGPKKHQDFASAIYRVRESHGGLSVVGTTVLKYKRCGTSIVQPFIVGLRNTPVNNIEATVVVGGNQACSEYSERATPLTYWHYPKSGHAFKFVHPHPDGITGQSVSILP